MQDGARRWLCIAACFGAASCASDPRDLASSEAEIRAGQRYDSDAAYRRGELVDSLVNPENGYSQLRLFRYTDSGWGALPEWNPRTSPVHIPSREPPAISSGTWARLAIEDVPWERDALLELGREAFFHYPVQLFQPLSGVIGGSRSPSYGFWTEGSRLGGTVWAELPSGEVAPFLTCAGCHASRESDRTIAGKNNADLDLEAAAADYYEGRAVVTSSGRAGRLDVTEDGLDNPAGITDLRAVRSQRHLHRAATLRNGLIPLAIRIETLLITALEESVRPPRKLAFAVALYLWNLETEPLSEPSSLSARGKTLFDQSCAGCHAPPRFSGPSVALEVVGTDRSVGDSPERSTGSYRVPSLRGVGDRKRLLANGAVLDVRELLDPARLAAGHRYGDALLPGQRDALLSYLSTL
ncbi:MAG TPA: cytochrome c [Polyangiaceae bacterium]